jgi:hypothetical protein
MEKSDGVIPSDITKNLMALGTNPSDYIADQMLKELQVNSNLSSGNSSYSPTVKNEITIQGNATEDTVRQLEEVSNKIIEKTITIFNRNRFQNGAKLKFN